MWVADFGLHHMRRESSGCWPGSGLEAADNHGGINFSKEGSVLSSIRALQCMVALPKNRHSLGVPQSPERQDRKNVVLPAETKQDLAQSWQAKSAQS